MSSILNKIVDNERELIRLKQELRNILNSNYYTTIQIKEFEINYKKKISELSGKRILFKREIIEGTFEVSDVDEDSKDRWIIRLFKMFPGETSVNIFIRMDYNPSKGNFNEIIFKLVKGDLVIVKSKIDWVSDRSIEVELIDIQKTSDKKCFIGTVCFDSFDSKEVILFRKFRDGTLNKLLIGRIFISTYYYFSPRISIMIERSFILKTLIKNVILYPIYYLIRFFRIV